MKVHYFQRYSTKENVATANTMLLFSRLYSYSPNKFFDFLKSLHSESFNNDFEPEIKFLNQEKGKKSVPDATITQKSFKIVIEVKMVDWFYNTQLKNHLEVFQNEDYKILLTISSEYMEKSKKDSIDKDIQNMNLNIKHINTTFEELAIFIKNLLDNRDYEMQDIIEDYFSYCNENGLISDSWKYMQIQPVGTTFDFNMKNNVYYNGNGTKFRAHEYIGLYKNKSVCAIGKIKLIVRTLKEKNELKFYFETKEKINKEEIENKIREIIKEVKEKYKHDLDERDTRYYFVEEFIETDYKKVSIGGMLGNRLLNLEKFFNSEIPDVRKIADTLKNKEWE